MSKTIANLCKEKNTQKPNHCAMIEIHTPIYVPTYLQSENELES